MMNHYMKEVQEFMKKSQELADRRTLIKGKLDTINMHPGLLPTKEEIIEHNIRKDVVDKLGFDKVYKQGLNINTPINLKLQKITTQSLRDGLISYDKRKGWRGALTNKKYTKN